MTLLQQQRLAKLRAQLERNLDKRDQTIEWLIRVSANIKSLTKSINRLEKRMAATPTPKAPEPIAPPPAPTTPVLDDGIPDFLRRSKPDATGAAIAAEIEDKRKAKARGRKQSGETRRMPLEGRDALKAILA